MAEKPARRDVADGRNVLIYRYCIYLLLLERIETDRQLLERLCDEHFDRLDPALVAVTHKASNKKSCRAIEEYVEAHGGQCDGLLRNWGVDADGEPVDKRRYTVTRKQYDEATA